MNASPELNPPNNAPDTPLASTGSTPLRARRAGSTQGRGRGGTWRALQGDASSLPAPRAPRWIQPFLDALRQTGNVSDAARVAGIDRTTPHHYRVNHPEFGELWREAEEEAADALELEARRRAMDGVARPVVYRGELVGSWVDEAGNEVPEGTAGASFVPLVVRKYSDNLLIFLLKRHRPDKYGDRMVGHQDPGRGGGPIEHRVRAGAPDFSRLSREQLLALRAIQQQLFAHRDVIESPAPAAALPPEPPTT